MFLRDHEHPPLWPVVKTQRFSLPYFEDHMVRNRHFPHFMPERDFWKRFYLTEVF